MKTLINATTAKLALAGLLLGGSLGLATAQAKEGDYIVTGMSGRVLAHHAKDFSVSTLTKRPGAVHGVVTGPANYWNYVIEESGANDHLLEVSPRSGYVGTLAKLPAAGAKTAVAIDVDSTVVVASNDGRLYRFDPAAKKITTIATGLGDVNAMTIDGDTGDYIVGRWTEQDLVRVDRATGRQTIIAVNVGKVTGVAFHPHTGHFVTISITAPTLKMIDRRGQFVKTANATARNAVVVDGPTGDVVTGGFYEIARFDKNLNPKFTKRTTENVLGLALYGAQKVVAEGPFTKGSVCTIKVNFRESANASYGGALVSLGMRPGLKIAGRKINMNVNDPLFFLSAGGSLEGLFTSGISGKLNGIGNAEILLVIPPFLPKGKKLYFTCNAVNPSKPGGLDFGNTIVIPVK